ncbi:glycoside hydrolase family 5 protein [Plantactinospora sp. KBS50]|uniref:glycoside hydrolase family 5 protein n=1 Tax=Plantactinospora sp. KBS50 TaxID=2024580 RepID=UPI0012FD29AC|nr:cellulase family glycosylhydrolase [Plantactinospora sp. KBS50]
MSGTQIVDGNGTPLLIRGIGLAGWLLMENWITGFPGHEEGQETSVRHVLGPDLTRVFYDRFIEHFFTAADAEFLASIGINVVRLPFHYKFFESDDAPFQIKPEGFRHLDRLIEQCARHGIYTMLDLHAVPGYQNQDWHSDNPTHVAHFWRHPHFQDRVVNLWRALAEHYRDEPYVLGYNPLNEPADPTAERVGPYYRRLVEAIREVDPDHIIFLDGNRYAMDFHFFGEPTPNVVYAPHDYPPPGFMPGARYPGTFQLMHVTAPRRAATPPSRSRRTTGTRRPSRRASWSAPSTCARPARPSWSASSTPSSTATTS